MSSAWMSRRFRSEPTGSIAPPRRTLCVLHIEWRAQGMLGEESKRQEEMPT